MMNDHSLVRLQFQFHSNSFGEVVLNPISSLLSHMVCLQLQRNGG